MHSPPPLTAINRELERFRSMACRGRETAFEGVCVSVAWSRGGGWFLRKIEEDGDEKRVKRRRHEEHCVVYSLLAPLPLSDEETNSYCHLRDAGKAARAHAPFVFRLCVWEGMTKAIFMLCVYLCHLLLLLFLSSLSLLNLCPPFCPPLLSSLSLSLTLSLPSLWSCLRLFPFLSRFPPAMSPRPCLQPFASSSPHRPSVSPPRSPSVRSLTCHTPQPGVGLIIPHSSFSFSPFIFATITPRDVHLTQRDISQFSIRPSFCSWLSSLLCVSVHPSISSLFFTLAQTCARTKLFALLSNSTFALLSCARSVFPLHIWCCTCLRARSLSFLAIFLSLLAVNQRVTKVPFFCQEHKHAPNLNQLHSIQFLPLKKGECCNPEIWEAVEGDVHGKADRRKTIFLFRLYHRLILSLSHCQPVVSPEFPRNKGRNKTVFLAPFIFHYHNDLGFVESFHVYLTVCVFVFVWAQQGVQGVSLLHCRSLHLGAQRLKRQQAHKHTHTHTHTHTANQS